MLYPAVTVCRFRTVGGTLPLPRSRRGEWLVSLLALSEVVFCAHSADAAIRLAEFADADPPTVAARVNDQSILVREVARQVRRIDRPQEMAPRERKRVEAEVLTQLIKRRLVQFFLQQKQLAASRQEVELTVESLRSQLRGQGLTLEQHLDRQRMTEAELRSEISWKIGWQRFLDRYLTEANLKQYFARHARDFDGTKLRVAHILFKLPADAAAGQRAMLRERAMRLARQIRAGEVTFSEAARRYSDAPTAGQGGDIGWIQRDEPMPDGFTKVAFALQNGQVSGPVRTRFGIHLIQCLQIKPGRRTWSDVRPELRAGLTLYLFGWAADQQARVARVVWTGAIPRVDNDVGSIRKNPAGTPRK